MSIKNFSISGIGPSVTLGKGGPTLAANGSNVELGGSALVTSSALGTTIGDYLDTNSYIDQTALTAALADYLLLAGGTMTGNIVLGANKITTSATTFANNELVTKSYVDGVAQGLDIKQSVRVASTANIVISTGGLQTVDGVTVVAGDRVLVKNQFGNEQAGIYVAAVGAWSRAPDADTNGKLNAGSFVFVEEGTTQADTGWVVTTDNPITIGTTPITWTQFSSAGAVEIVGGNGITASGSTVSADVDGATLTATGGTGAQLAVAGGTTGQVLTAVTGDDAVWGAVPADATKADIVDGAVDGNFAGLDASGNLTDSGSAPADFQPIDADLTAIAALSGDGLIRKTTGTYAMDTATYLTSLSGAVLANGTTALTADWNVGGTFTVTNLGTPTDPSDASTKQYVDDAIAGVGGDNTGKVLVFSTAISSASVSGNIAVDLPTGSIIHKAVVKVTTIFDNAATLLVGADADTDNVEDGTGSDLLTVGTYVIDSYYLTTGSPDTDAVWSITGTPTVGAGTLIVEYSLPVA